MKTKKYFFMAALAILMTACSSDDNELTQLPVKAEGITITAQLAPKSSSAKTSSSESHAFPSRFAAGSGGLSVPPLFPSRHARPVCRNNQSRCPYQGLRSPGGEGG